MDLTKCGAEDQLMDAEEHAIATDRLMPYF